MRLSWDGVMALVGCVVVAVLPLPRRVEGVRIGLFGTVLGYVFYDAMRSRSQPREPVAVAVQQEARPVVDPELLRSTSDDRLGADQLLTDFSILRHLRRLGAVSDTEFEAKKADILRRV